MSVPPVIHAALIQKVVDWADALTDRFQHASDQGEEIPINLNVRTTSSEVLKEHAFSLGFYANEVMHQSGEEHRYRNWVNTIFVQCFVDEIHTPRDMLRVAYRFENTIRARCNLSILDGIHLRATRDDEVLPELVIPPLPGDHSKCCNVL